ncbi:MAG: hypothetical protein O7B81_11290, partial [Gammaproteobacteria bacterium]|nr:hypothetical protein [Gammaproteobacteria bacterium]
SSFMPRLKRTFEIAGYTRLRDAFSDGVTLALSAGQFIRQKIRIKISRASTLTRNPQSGRCKVTCSRRLGRELNDPRL